MNAKNTKILKENVWQLAPVYATLNFLIILEEVNYWKKFQILFPCGIILFHVEVFLTFINFLLIGGNERGEENGQYMEYIEKCGRKESGWKEE